MTEETFARELWGDDAYRVLHTCVFYRPSGTEYNKSTQFSDMFKRYTARYLKAGLTAADYRHLAAAFGRHLLAIEIEADEDLVTTGMDAAAGRSTQVSERVYGIQNEELGTLNDRTLAVHRAIDRLWQSKLLKLSVPGAVASADQIESAAVPLNQDGSLNVAAPSLPADSSQLLGVIQGMFQQFEQSLLQKIVPAVVQQLQHHQSSPTVSSRTRYEEENVLGPTFVCGFVLYCEGGCWSSISFKDFDNESLEVQKVIEHDIQQVKDAPTLIGKGKEKEVVSKLLYINMWMIINYLYRISLYCHQNCQLKWILRQRIA